MKTMRLKQCLCHCGRRRVLVVCLKILHTVNANNSPNKRWKLCFSWKWDIGSTSGSKFDSGWLLDLWRTTFPVQRNVKILSSWQTVDTSQCSPDETCLVMGRMTRHIRCNKCFCKLFWAIWKHLNSQARHPVVTRAAEVSLCARNDDRDTFWWKVIGQRWQIGGLWSGSGPNHNQQSVYFSSL